MPKHIKPAYLLDYRGVFLYAFKNKTALREIMGMPRTEFYKHFDQRTFYAGCYQITSSRPEGTPRFTSINTLQKFINLQRYVNGPRQCPIKVTDTRTGQTYRFHSISDAVKSNLKLGHRKTVTKYLSSGALYKDIWLLERAPKTGQKLD